MAAFIVSCSVNPPSETLVPAFDSSEDCFNGRLIFSVGDKFGIADASDSTILVQAAYERLMTELKAEANKPAIAAAEAFVKKYAAGKDVKQIGNTGVYYKVLKEGNGAKPTAESTVKINYEGKNMKGKVFDSSYKRNEPATMSVGQVIPGFTEALKAMPVGSKWEVCIPQDKAYGERPAGEDIPAYSALVFTIELLSIEKAAAQPQVQGQPIQIK